MCILLLTFYTIYNILYFFITEFGDHHTDDSAGESELARRPLMNLIRSTIGSIAGVDDGDNGEEST